MTREAPHTGINVNPHHLAVVHQLATAAAAPRAAHRAIFRSYADYLRASGASARTVTDRVAGARRLMTLACVEEPARLTTLHAISYVGSVNARASRATYAQHVRSFARFLNFIGEPAVFADAMPVPRFPKGAPRPIDVNELAAAVAAATARERSMLLLAAYAGLRVSEIGRVRGEDVDAGGIYVRGKGGEDEIVPTHPLLAAEAARYPRVGFWFPGVRGRGLERTSVWRHMRRALNRVGSTATPHQVRHYYGTALLDAGANLRVVQELMRHASVATTQRYTLVRSRDRLAAIAALPLLDETG